MEYIDGAYIDIYLTENGTVKRTAVDEILYITRENRRTSIVTRADRLSSTESYDALIARLPALFFYSVHKSFFVNLHYVDTYTYKELVLSDGTHIPVAPRRQEAFHNFW